MLLTPTALAATLLRARLSPSSYTVTHYKYTGTHIRYEHLSTSESAMRSSLLSQGCLRHLEAHTYLQTRDLEGGSGRWTGASMGAAERPSSCRSGLLRPPDATQQQQQQQQEAFVALRETKKPLPPASSTFAPWRTHFWIAVKLTSVFYTSAVLITANSDVIRQSMAVCVYNCKQTSLITPKNDVICQSMAVCVYNCKHTSLKVTSVVYTCAFPHYYCAFHHYLLLKNKRCLYLFISLSLFQVYKSKGLYTFISAGLLPG